MVLDVLGENLRKTLSKLTGATYVDEKLINEIVKEFQRALLQSDVNVKLVFELTNNIKERAKEAAPAGLTKKEHIINIVYEELTAFLGGEDSKLDISKKPFTIMLVGLFGSGKTTCAGKLARYYSLRGKKVALVSTDIWRPAAYEQLRQIGESLKIDTYGIPGEKNPVKIWRRFEPEKDDYDIVICDTAGRDALSDELVDELRVIDGVVVADEKLLVISADVGQSAQKQAEMFHDTVGVTGVIITKLDGTAKGGGALSACSVTGAHVRFIGVGEKPDAFEEFKPKNFVGRLLGMGDLDALLEKAKVAIDEDEAKDLGKKLLKGDFSLIDLHEQMAAMKKMGPLNKVMDLVPGMSGLKIPKEALQTQEASLEKWKFIMNSMTKEELEEPERINSSRIQRIAAGCGQPEKEIRNMLKQYRQSKKVMKMMKGKSSEKAMQKMMSKVGKGGPQLKF